MGEWGRETEESLDSTFADYLQHFGAYLMLSLLVVGASLTTLRPSALICGIAAVLHGIATEALQHFIPRRTCDWTDALANAGGAFIGWLLIDRLEFILQKTARRKRRA
jgi:VanZ family protein